ncbi:1,2-dihydroxy-3-keto-5-methylthiopentene dioxygenase [Apophysomyces ossiformis]|uniref:Acireductone dioxygenase n=1 Tax=Apophysomyces ossiformis TaxID=679940 RepID=A0A8H7BI89_9FUNG|nr:1,2-dihydroxy-3-keto-5-methylthiopentene dioxygenase [Apophysomyces ossiformis]
MKAYLYDNTDLDQRELHDSGVTKSVEELRQLGVLYWRFDGPDALDKINQLALERKYKNRDEIVVSPEAMGEIYETKVKSFFAEHIHEDEEIRYILDGSGFFDVRDKEDAWIRIYMEKGDMIVLPAGIYHRFTTDTRNYIKAMRLFKEDPQWTPINRPLADDNTYRTEYLKEFNITAH